MATENERERDLVLNPNEYSYVLDKTKGLISCVTGPYKMSLSNSDALVVFNEKTKRFEDTMYTGAISTYVSAPENWYVVLKNPAKGGQHPTSGKSNDLPELEIGKKVNIPGNVSFALYPGQMAKVIQGHTLRSNQYLVAQVYDASVFGKVDVLDEDGEPTGEKRDLYSNGQLLIIKGTDVSFYIPPTGIEVVPIPETGEYVRDAVTLRRLEYCILNNESGEKKYVGGSAVVFPEPDESFEINKTTGGYIFKAIELSEISGIYVKVNTDYYEDGCTDVVVDEDGNEIVKKDKRKLHKAGEELFITGKDQMIYFPRTEHTIIDYGGKILHHATAIPKGEGRYVMNRKTGEIRTVLGPAMYLPDPREEVFVQRKLTKRECELWYPGNKEVLEYNVGSDKLPKATLDNLAGAVKYFVNSSAEPSVTEDVFSRGTTYTKPRTVTFDNKYEGAVQINVWTGYAVNVVSKSGKRKVVVGPQTCILDYDETLEEIKAYKDDAEYYYTVYLEISDNMISDTIHAQTKDFVDVRIDLNYNVRFDENYMNDWFNVKCYSDLLITRENSVIKREIKQHTIEDFCNNAVDIIRNAVINPEDGVCVFKENGMQIYDIDVEDITFIDDDIKSLFNDHQAKIIQKTLDLSAAEKDTQLTEGLAKAELIKADLEYQGALHALNLKEDLGKATQEAIDHIQQKRIAYQKTMKQAEKELLKLSEEIQKSKLNISKATADHEIEIEQKKDDLALHKQNVYADNAKKIIDSVSPDLVAAMNSTANADLMAAVTSAMGPYAIARGESVSEVTNMLLRGTSLEGIIGDLMKKVERIPSEEVIIENKDGKVIEESSAADIKPKKRATKTKVADTTDV